MSSCIFCDILKEKASASFVLKGAKCSAFMDIFPINEGHLLIVPHEHIERYSELDEATAYEMFAMGTKLMKAIEKTNLKCDGANIFLSDGEIAGQEVPHCHLHIVPRFLGDKLSPSFFNADPREAKREYLDQLAGTIQKEL